MPTREGYTLREDLTTWTGSSSGSYWVWEHDETHKLYRQPRTLGYWDTSQPLQRVQFGR